MREDHFYLINLKEEERSPESKVPYGPPSFNPISYEAALELAQKTKQQFDSSFLGFGFMLDVFI